MGFKWALHTIVIQKNTHIQTQMHWQFILGCAEILTLCGNEMIGSMVALKQKQTDILRRPSVPQPKPDEHLSLIQWLPLPCPPPFLYISCSARLSVNYSKHSLGCKTLTMITLQGLLFNSKFLLRLDLPSWWFTINCKWSVFNCEHNCLLKWQVCSHSYAFVWSAKTKKHISGMTHGIKTNTMDMLVVNLCIAFCNFQFISCTSPLLFCCPYSPENIRNVWH